MQYLCRYLYKKSSNKIKICNVIFYTHIKRQRTGQNRFTKYSNMVQIGGKYQLVKNENFLEHLVALGVPEDKATESSLEKPIINITVNGKNITICVENIKNPHCSNLILDQEVDEVFGGTNFKSFAKLDGDILTVNAKFPDGKTGKRVYSFSDSDLVLSYSNSKSEVPEAKRYYKRL